jgi:hypothetical protein
MVAVATVLTTLSGMVDAYCNTSRHNSRYISSELSRLTTNGLS